MTLLVFGVASLWSANATAESPAKKADGPIVSIPIEQVWAFRMPGTRDLGQITPAEDLALVYAIRTGLKFPAKGSKARPAFVVSGDVATALAVAKDTLVQGKPPRPSFHTTDDISVVFFSHASPMYVHLESVRRANNEIEVRYRYVSHEESWITDHFAIIPLGRLPTGKYRIKIVQSPMDATLLAKGHRPPSRDFTESAVSKSSQFEVTD
jgi:hypothetical protein